MKQNTTLPENKKDTIQTKSSAITIKIRSGLQSGCSVQDGCCGCEYPAEIHNCVLELDLANL